jgi:fluoride exporter
MLNLLLAIPGFRSAAMRSIDASPAISYRLQPERRGDRRRERVVAYLWVALGGAAGAAARYGVAQWAGARWGWSFPWGTFAVNITGSLAIGLLMALLIGRGADPAYRFLLVTGFLGGYTTFSAFSLETLSLVETRRFAEAALYVGGSVLLGLLGCFGGLVVGRLLIR